jgi:hypothetical protein
MIILTLAVPIKTWEFIRIKLSPTFDRQPGFLYHTENKEIRLIDKKIKIYSKNVSFYQVSPLTRVLPNLSLKSVRSDDT